MTTPTQRLTDRAAAILDDDVAIAVRVRPCASRHAPVSAHVAYSENGPWPNALPASGLPVVPMYRSLKQSVTDMVAPDVEHPNGVIAFLRSGDRVFMGRDRFRSLQPTTVLRRLEGTQPASIDMGLLSADLIPKLTVAGECFIVNSVDFGVLTRTVVEGGIDEPQLAEELRPYYEQALAFRHYDPNTLRAMIPGQGDATKTGS